MSSEVMKSEIPPGKILRFKRLQGLKCFDTVIAMIENSTPVREIAMFIQDEALEYKDVSRRYLQTLLQQYIGQNAMRFIDDQMPTRHLSLTNSISERVDPMDVYQVLIAIHSERMMMDFAQEKRTGRTTSQNTTNVRVMSEILASMANIETTRKYRFKEFQQTRGVEDTLAHLQKVKNEYNARWGETTANMITDPAARRRILNAIEQARSGAHSPLAALLKLRETKEETVTVNEEK